MSSPAKSIVSVMCTCDGSPNVLGYSVILIPNGNNNHMIIANDNSCDFSSSFNVISGEQYDVFAFAIMRNSGITETSSSYIGTYPFSNGM